MREMVVLTCFYFRKGHLWLPRSGKRKRHERGDKEYLPMPFCRTTLLSLNYHEQPKHGSCDQVHFISVALRLRDVK